MIIWNAHEHMKHRCTIYFLFIDIRIVAKN